jgi:predicted metal-binding membrane protein
MAVRPDALTRQRYLILGVLLTLTVVAWSLLIRQAEDMRDEMGLTMGMGFVLFLAIWITMMVAMMFPTAAPMILTFDRIQASRRQHAQAGVPTWLFVISYLAVWTGAGVAAYAAAAVGEVLGERSMWLMDNAGRIGGAVLVVAGIYQLTPLKSACLSKCRTPTGFIMTSWRDGTGGALRMGFEHGAYCLGCCWLLFVILFPLGIMNVAAMAAVTLLIFAEKSLPLGVWVSRGAAVVLLLYGVLVLFSPGALPSTM